MPTVEDYLSFWSDVSYDRRLEFTAEALQIMRAEGLDLSNPDSWTTLGWVFADNARAQSDTDLATTGACLAASMFAYAAYLREPNCPN